MSDAFRQVCREPGAWWQVPYRSKTWPIIGIIQGLKTAANIVMKNGKKDHPSVAHYGT